MPIRRSTSAVPSSVQSTRHEHCGLGCSASDPARRVVDRQCLRRRRSPGAVPSGDQSRSVTNPGGWPGRRATGERVPGLLVDFAEDRRPSRIMIGPFAGSGRSTKPGRSVIQTRDDGRRRLESRRVPPRRSPAPSTGGRARTGRAQPRRCGAAEIAVHDPRQRGPHLGPPARSDSARCDQGVRDLRAHRVVMPLPPSPAPGRAERSTDVISPSRPGRRAGAPPPPSAGRAGDGARGSADRSTLRRSKAARSDAVSMPAAALSAVGSVHIRDVDLAHPAPVSQHVATSIQDDPVEPRVEAVHVAECREVPPGRHERLLGDLLRLGLVAEDRPSRPERRLGPGLHEQAEGDVVATAGARDQRVAGWRRAARSCRRTRSGPSLALFVHHT